MITWHITWSRRACLAHDSWCMHCICSHKKKVLQYIKGSNSWYLSIMILILQELFINLPLFFLSLPLPALSQCQGLNVKRFTFFLKEKLPNLNHQTTKFYGSVGSWEQHVWLFDSLENVLEPGSPKGEGPKGRKGQDFPKGHLTSTLNCPSPSKIHRILGTLKYGYIRG